MYSRVCLYIDLRQLGALPIDKWLRGLHTRLGVRGGVEVKNVTHASNTTFWFRITVVSINCHWNVFSAMWKEV